VRIAVCVAAVPNPDKVKWDRFRQLLDLQDAEPVLNPADRNALELAAQLAKSSGDTFDVYSAGPGASAALREAAVFGAQRLIAISDSLLESADEAGVAAVLDAAISKDGADVVVCGPQTTSYGSGSVAGYLSAALAAGLRADVVALESEGPQLRVTQIDGASLVRSNASTPLVVAAAPYGIATRTVSPILLMRASKKPVEELTLSDVSDGRINSISNMPSTGVTDGPLESNRKKRANEIVDGPDAAARAITLVGALRDRQLV
jgi:electron transfer flavoprotein beta subunit